MGAETGLLPKLPSLARVDLSLIDAGIPLLFFPVLPLRSTCGVDLVASQIDVQFLTIKPFVCSAPPLMPPRVQQSNLLNTSQAKTARGNIFSSVCLCSVVSISLTTVELRNIKGQT